MPSATATWAVRQLRQMDWQTRAHHVRLLKEWRTPMYWEVINLMGPDEIVDGLATGIPVLSDSTTVIGKNKAESTRQTKIEEYFNRVR